MQYVKLQYYSYCLLTFLVAQPIQLATGEFNNSRVCFRILWHPRRRYFLRYARLEDGKHILSSNRPSSYVSW